MFKKLESLINFIQKEYIQFNEKWQKSEYYYKFNLKNNLVSDLVNNETMLETIFNYREFINENNIQLVMDFKQFNSELSKVNIRTKTKNSIEFKIKNYNDNHENGKIPIEKCLNDLFGIRIICGQKLNYDELSNFINENYIKLKCINSSKGDYKATHIYFKENNFNFQWELQIWNKEDEINNIISHEKYKQEYVKWEKENKGG